MGLEDKLPSISQIASAYGLGVPFSALGFLGGEKEKALRSKVLISPPKKPKTLKGTPKL